MYLMLSLHYILKYPGCRDQGGRFREPSSWAGGSCWTFRGFLGLLLAVLGASAGTQGALEANGCTQWPNNQQLCGCSQGEKSWVSHKEGDEESGLLQLCRVGHGGKGCKCKRKQISIFIILPLE